MRAVETEAEMTRLPTVGLSSVDQETLVNQSPIETPTVPEVICPPICNKKPTNGSDRRCGNFFRRGVDSNHQDSTGAACVRVRSRNGSRCNQPMRPNLPQRISLNAVAYLAEQFVVAELLRKMSASSGHKKEETHSSPLV